MILKFFRKILKKQSADQIEMNYLRSQGLIVGKNFNSYTPYPFDSGWPWLITVGDNVTFSTNVKILAHDASTNKVKAHTKIGTVTIGNNVFLGHNVTVCCNTRIGNNVVIGAGSVITKDIPDDVVAAGNPAKIICSIKDFEKKHHENLETHIYFNQYKWNEWKNAPIEEKQKMKELLKDTFGYV